MVLNLVNDLLDLAKISAFKFTLDVDYFDLIQVIEQALATIQPYIEEKELEMITHFDADLRSGEISFSNYEDISVAGSESEEEI